MPILKAIKWLSRRFSSRNLLLRALQEAGQVHRHSARLPDACRRARRVPAEERGSPGPSGIRTSPQPYCRTACGAERWHHAETNRLVLSRCTSLRGEKRRIHSGRTGYLYQADALTQSQRQESITLLAKTMGLPEPVIASYLSHRPPTTIAPVNAQVAALQQQTADLFYQNRLVPKQVNIRERIWQPAGKEGAKS